MRILVMGASGQLARALVDLDGRPAAIRSAGRPEFDITDADSVERAIGEAETDIVVNAAAYTAVDKAESDPEQAFAVNAAGAANVAAATAAAGIPLIHISTDYVFSGDKPAPYTEADQTDPLGVYGKSKLKGEQLVASLNPAYAIFRTAWVYSPYGSNFVKTMLRLAGDRDVVRVVDDQRGTPSYAPHLAQAIIAAARRILADPSAPDWRGTFHMTAQGEATWADFAEAIFDISKGLGGPYATVERIDTLSYPTPARRPANSRLDTGRFTTIFGHRLPEWRQGVEAVIPLLLAQNQDGAP